MASRELHPILLIACLGAIALLAISLHLAGVADHPAQQLTALVVVLFFVAVVLLSPVNGLMLLFLVPSLFNGEDQRPYFWLLEVLVYLTLGVAFVGHLWRRQPMRFPCAFFFLLLLISTIVSFPLHLRELWLHIEVQSWQELLHAIRSADLFEDLFYLRTVLNVGSGIALYALTVDHGWSREEVLQLTGGASVFCLVTTAVGLLLYRLGGFGGDTFLTLRVGGWEVTRGFGGLGFNVSYFAQYALAYLPLVALVLVERARTWAKGVAFGAVLVTGFAIVITYQRSAYLLLLVELGLLVVAAARLGTLRRLPAWVPVAGAAASVVLLMAALLLVTSVGARALERVAALWHLGDPYREHVLAVSWRMFLDHPLLGAGSGQYAHVFPLYSAEPGKYHWGSLSSHNLYMQFLAEQGALGLVSFLAILGLTLVPVLRAQRRLGAERPAVLFLLVSLGTWLTYGLFQYTFLMRSMQVYFWIALGLVVSLTLGVAPPLRIRRRWLGVALAILLVMAGLRLYEALARPLPPGVAVGVYAWEPGTVRWTRGAALLTLRVESPILRLPLAFPLMPATGRIQIVDIAIDDSPVRRVTLDSPAWRTIDIPVAQAPGSTIRLSLRTGYTVTPATLGLNPDQRRLGVLMGPIGWTSG